MNIKFFAGRKVLVMGLGRFGGGVDVAKFACGAGAKVTVTDLAAADKLVDSIDQLKDFKDIEFHLGSHEPADFEQADIVIANPAVPPDNKFLKIARQANKFVTSQINIFLELCPAPIIGITGSNGKSTTSALTAHILRNAYERRDFGELSRTATSDQRQGVLPKHIFTWRSHVIPNECEESAEKTAAKPPTSSPKDAKYHLGNTPSSWWY